MILICKYQVISISTEKQNSIERMHEFFNYFFKASNDLFLDHENPTHEDNRKFSKQYFIKDRSHQLIFMCLMLEFSIGSIKKYDVFSIFLIGISYSSYYGMS